MAAEERMTDLIPKLSKKVSTSGIRRYSKAAEKENLKRASDDEDRAESDRADQSRSPKRSKVRMLLDPRTDPSLQSETSRYR